MLFRSDLGVPWSRLQAAGHTYDNASEEAKTYWNRVVSLCRSLEDEVNISLAPRLGNGNEVGWFDLTSVDVLKTKPEPTTARVGAPALLQSLVMKIDEARADYGLPPLPNGMGDRYLSAEEMLIIQGGSGTDDSAERMVAVLERLERSKVPALPASTGDAPPAAVAAAPSTREAVGQENRAPSAAEIEARRARIWNTTDRVATTLEKQWERAFRRLFTKQQASTLGRLTGKRGRQAERRDTIDPSSLFDEAFWRNQTSELAADLYESVAAAAGARVAEVFGIDFDLDNPAMQDLIRDRANQLAGQVTDTTYRQITDALAEGASVGEDVAELAKRVEHVFAEATKNRSVVIARTEVVSAFNGSTAQLAAILPDDVVAGQEWIATRDGRTRESHAAADGQVRAPGVPFSVAGASMLYPGDPSGPADETIQCRCTLALLTPEDMAERAADRSRRHPLERADAVITLAGMGQFDRAQMRARLRSAA